MQIAQENIDRTCNESEIYFELFAFPGRLILELGCGAAAQTRIIAQAHSDCRIDAMEVDEIQHRKNLCVTDLPNVSFLPGGAEDITAPDGTYDLVFLFKSLHHVPVKHMDRALAEIRRVLKPGGSAYVSEPVYAGELNDLMRLFHDERVVREAAFAAVKKAVQDGLFRLRDELFFNTEVLFKNFREFETQVIGASFADHRLDTATYRKVQEGFAANLTDTGARFTNPMRVDILAKP